MIDGLARKLASKAYKLASNSTTLKNNPNATTTPSVTDDKDAGYDVGSTWTYENITYTCVDSTVGKAVWQSSSDIVTFNTWSEVVAAISILSPSYIGKYALVANANGAPSAGITYTAPNALTDFIVDGGSATLKINAQGTNYSVTTMPRTITNPIITSVMLISSAKPNTKGYYIFTVTPSDGLPSGCNLNDVCYFNGSTWSVWQSYSMANTVLVANTTSGIGVTWRKFNRTWMSTADEFNTDGKEYQTGKLWNGKAVFRRGISATTNSSTTTLVTTLSMPTVGKLVSIWATIKRADGNWTQVTASGNEILLDINSSGYAEVWSGAALYQGRPFYMWIEYTKS